MKNSLLIVLITTLSFFAYHTNNKLSNKPLVDYTISNSFPVVTGDTVHIHFQFNSECDLKSFVANVQPEIGGGKLNEKIEFAGGKKKGDLSYSFIVPNTYHHESMINFDFTVANKFSSEKVFIAVPLYNPPHDLLADIDSPNENSEFIIKSFYSSRSLMLKNELLADISEVENFSRFTLKDLKNFKMPELEIKENIIEPKEFIASNLMNKNEELVKNDDEVLAANFISLPSLSDIIASENLSNSTPQQNIVTTSESDLYESKHVIKSRNIVSSKIISSINNETKQVSDKLYQSSHHKEKRNSLSNNKSISNHKHNLSVNNHEESIADDNSFNNKIINEKTSDKKNIAALSSKQAINKNEAMDIKSENMNLEIQSTNISDEKKLADIKFDEVEEDLSTLGIVLAKSSEIEIQIK